MLSDLEFRAIAVYCPHNALEVATNLLIHCSYPSKLTPTSQPNRLIQ